MDLGVDTIRSLEWASVGRGGAVWEQAYRVGVSPERISREHDVPEGLGLSVRAAEKS